MKNKSVKLLSFASLALGLSLSAQAKIVDEIENIFDVKPDATFALENVNGSVKISGWDQSTIKVTALIEAENEKARERVSVEMKQTKNGVDVETKYKKNTGNYNNGSSKVTYTVFVPTSTELDDIELVNGSLVISGVHGEISADLVNGSITAEDMVNNAEFNSVNGSVKVSYSALAETLKEIELETVNGSIKLYLPKNIGAKVKAETTHGSMKSDFGLAVSKNSFSGKSMQGVVGDGAIKVSLESVNGNVQLRQN